ncbi:unnamed protein product [Arctia plantaginis]|uniref:Uncharacterized protein n=1 Tax=Arctia plantaginis TaxID=874455 RepID=A0A8S1BBU5_ARCPL|nr:unnamed protein product [Arctia plantaginis]
MSFESEEKVMFTDTDTSEDQKACIISPEIIRKSSVPDLLNTSWDPSFHTIHDIKEKDYDKTPPFVSVMITDDTDHPCHELGNITNSSTQTEPYVSLPVNSSYVDVSLSFNKDFNSYDSVSNDNSEQSLGSKRNRRDSSDAEYKEARPKKKTKCTDSCSSSTSDLTDSKHKLGPSMSSSVLSSNSEASFKSINSNHSYKIRKRRLKSESNLFKDALQRSRRTTFSVLHSGNLLSGKKLQPIQSLCLD